MSYAPRWKPDSLDAQREADAAERMEHLMGLDTEINCGQCPGTRQPYEVHCYACNGHHRAGDTETCQRAQRIERERVEANRKAWAETRKMVRRRRRAA